MELPECQFQYSISTTTLSCSWRKFCSTITTFFFDLSLLHVQPNGICSPNFVMRIFMGIFLPLLTYRHIFTKSIDTYSWWGLKYYRSSDKWTTILVERAKPWGFTRKFKHTKPQWKLEPRNCNKQCRESYNDITTELNVTFATSSNASSTGASERRGSMGPIIINCDDEECKL